jgi:Domain of unknown function (DUF4037)
VGESKLGNGIALAGSYWSRVVRPILEDGAPDLPRVAARIGPGSDVLGLDDEMSRDHDWGLRLQLLVPTHARAATADMLNARLPDAYAGHPTRITFSGQRNATLALDVLTIEELIQSRLGFDPRHGATPTDWLSLTGQAVLEVIAGEVFEDATGELTSLRQALTWYPDDVWRYVVACDWQRIDQELPLMQRAGHRGDDLGSRVIAARLVDVAIHLAFMLCRRWVPYSKWRGTLFHRLPLPGQVGSRLTAVLTASDWRARGEHLAAALELLAHQQQRMGMPTASPVCVQFWDRPYLHVHQDLTSRVLDGIDDPTVRQLGPGLGSIEQRTDNVELLLNTARRRAALAIPADP